MAKSRLASTLTSCLTKFLESSLNRQYTKDGGVFTVFVKTNMVKPSSRVWLCHTLRLYGLEVHTSKNLVWNTEQQHPMPTFGSDGWNIFFWTGQDATCWEWLQNDQSRCSNVFFLKTINNQVLSLDMACGLILKWVSHIRDLLVDSEFLLARLEYQRPLTWIMWTNHDTNALQWNLASLFMITCWKICGRCFPVWTKRGTALWNCYDSSVILTDKQ